VDIARGKMVDRELDAMIERRSSREPDRDEREELWKASVRAYTARREEELRAAWCQHHQEQAARLRVVLEGLVSRHEAEGRTIRTERSMRSMTTISAKKLKERGNGFKNVKPRRQMKAKKASLTKRGRPMRIGRGWV
jgi:hypothetical protein